MNRPRAVLVAVLLAAGLAPATATVSAATGYSNLAAAFDNVGIATGTDPQAGNIDGQGHSLSAEDLAAAGWPPGTAVTVAGATLTWPTARPGRVDNAVAAGQTISLRGAGTALALLVAATNGESSGTGRITYTDGSQSSYQVSAPDWVVGVNDTKTLTMPHWNTPTGASFVTTKLYTVLAPVDPNRTVRSITLPSTTGGALHVFAIGLRAATTGWAGTWSAAIDDGLVNGPWTDRTLRMIEHTSIGGTQARIRLDNAFGRAPVTIGHATIAVQDNGSSSSTARPRTLAFGGRSSVTIPAGGQAMSDSLGFAVPPDTNLLVSLYLPGPVQLASAHSLGMQDMYSSADYSGDHTTDVTGFPTMYTFGFWTLLSGIDVTSSTGTVVALGDSITDGVGSTYNGNDRWPNDLARRLLAQTPAYGVVDEGISANRIVTDLFNGDPGGFGGIRALARLDRDVFSQSGVRSVVVLEGINDLKAGTPADQVIAGLQQIAAQAHAYGLRVIVATITPFKGWGEYADAYEANRQQVNAFIRTNGGAFDTVVDFDAVTRDPADPQQLLAAYDSGDHLHPNAAGYHAMADAIDLSTL